LKLPSEATESIMNRRLALLEDDAALRSPNEERRARVRYRASLRAPCRLADGGGAWVARVRDVSTLGIALSLPERLAEAALLDVELQRCNGAMVRRVLARVVHVTRENSCSWLAGCAFTSELTGDELRLFHAEAVRPPVRDNRRWLRFPCNVETICYTCETIPGERRPARVLNVSPGGIGLLLPCQFGAGTLLHFALPTEADQPARALLVRVVRVIEQAPGMWFLGCEFAHQLEDDELHQLLR
jgi:hypothetical protein